MQVNIENTDNKKSLVAFLTCNANGIVDIYFLSLLYKENNKVIRYQFKLFLIAQSNPREKDILTQL